MLSLGQLPGPHSRRPHEGLKPGVSVATLRGEALTKASGPPTFRRANGSALSTVHETPCSLVSVFRVRGRGMYPGPTRHVRSRRFQNHPFPEFLVLPSAEKLSFVLPGLQG